MRTTVMKFPEEGVGELLDGRLSEEPKIADAQGEVTVFGRPKLVLRLSDLWSRSSPSIAAVPLDTLHGLRFVSASNCETLAPHVSSLKHLRMLDLSGTGIGDDLFLSFVTSLPRLRVIQFGGTRVSDRAFRDMPRLNSVRILRTLGRSVAIGDKALACVGVKLPGLITLDFSGTKAGDEGLRGVTHLRLRSLNILGSKLTDAGLASLATMTSLRNLVLSYTQITDRGLYFLQTCRRIRLLMLDGTAITDRGLQYLQLMPNLQVLYLNSTGITNEAVRWLVQMTKLRVLSIGKQITSDRVQLLREALPNCRISAIPKRPQEPHN